MGSPEALKNLADPRRVVLTVLPGHGLVMVEKWAPGVMPFQVLWEAMDTGHIAVKNRVPQGPVAFVPGPAGTRCTKSERDLSVLAKCSERLKGGESMS